MVFAIPDWEDGASDKKTVFSEKAEFNQKKTKKSRQKKESPQTTINLNSISDKSKVINKLNKKLQQRQKQKDKRRNTNNEENVKNLTAKKLYNSLPNNQKSLENSITESKSKQNKLKPKKIKRKMNQNNHSNTSLKVDNIDTDKLDEVLLNAKKKEYNKAFERDDIEALLFKEDKSLEVKKKSPKAKLKLTNTQNGKKEIEKPTKEKVVKSKIIKAKNLINKIPAIEKMYNTVKGLKENKPIVEKSEIINKPSLKTPQERKKEKLKLMLKDASNRNSINFNRNKLRERMLDRLKSAQFRFLNEKLYTSSGSEASQLFQKDPSAFQSYHEGYQQQIKKWPVNPLDVIIKRIKKMPKSHHIADMGCGEAGLAKRVPHAVRSFDLVGAAPGVEVCDMAHTPLLAASVHAVVFCLALMGTDLTAYLVEANRVLKLGGHLLIAEVESRFNDVNSFTKDVTRLGFKLVKLDREHEVFFFMEFVKNQDPPVKKSKLPMLTLKPCIYKRR